MKTDRLQRIIAFLALVPAVALLAVAGVDDALLPRDVMVAGWDRWGQAAIMMGAYLCLAAACLRTGRVCEVAATMCLTALLLAALWQAGVGLLQVYGWEVSRHSLYALTGTFFNPGPYAGFLAVLTPLALDTWLKYRRATRGEWGTLALCVLSVAVLVMVLCVLPATRSRAAWLAALCACLWVAGRHVTGTLQASARWNRWYARRRYALWSLVAVAVCALAIASTFIRPASANGRLLIWKVALEAVADCPLAGHASAEYPAFGGVYGRYQEAYFASGQATPDEEQVAGVPQYAFNEFVEGMVMYGVPAVLIVVLLCVGIGWYACRRREEGVAGALIALAVFACFSYPLHFPAFWAVLLVLVVRLLLLQPASRGLLAVVGVVLLAYVGWVQRPRLAGWQAFYHGWADCRLLYRTQAYTVAARAYTHCDSVAGATGHGRANADFLFEGGHALYKAGRYEEAIGYLQRAGRVSADPMIFNVMGECHQAQGRLAEAEVCFWRAAHRLPSRLYPYYLLAKLYADPAWNKVDEARRMARYVIGKEPKVPSPAIDDMKREMKVWLENEQSKILNTKMR